MSPVVAQQRARNNQPKDCTAYPSLWHNRNVQHSDEELKLEHQELGELLELEVHVHRDVGHHAEEHEEDDASFSSSSSLLEEPEEGLASIMGFQMPPQAPSPCSIGEE